MAIRKKRKPRNVSKAYTTWGNVIARCKPTYKEYRYYGGIGIAVCERWHSFQNFYADMGDPPTPSHSIDRINPLLGYFPDNCRWATKKEQSENRRHVMWVTCSGKTQTVKAWIREIGAAKSTVYDKIKRGIPPKQALGLS